MTNKEMYLHHLYEARVEYIRWVGMIKLLSAGLYDASRQPIELNALEIGFGKWFYQEAMLFADGTCTSTVSEIEVLWTDIHSHFMEIYEVCAQKQKNSIFGTKKPLSDAVIKISTVHYSEIIILSDKLKKELRLFEKQLNAKAESEFTMFGNYMVAQEHVQNAQQVKNLERAKLSSNVGVSGARGAYLSE